MKWISCNLLVHIFFIMCLFSDTYQEETTLVKDLKFKLHSGDLFPMIGFGTYLIQGTQLIRDVIDRALAAGYRSIDSAAIYGNEQDIGKALKELLPKYNLTRQDIFITTKLWASDQGDKAYQALEKSLSNLDTPYVDLYLIHWPGVFGANASKENNSTKRDRSWQLLVKGVRNGLARNIGVSNYNVRHLRELLANDHGIKPAVNQVEWNPHYHQAELLDLCRKEGILLQAYTSLGGSNHTDLLDDPKVNKIAKKLGKSSAQVLLRWSLQQNIAIIPKARSKKHIEENLDLNFFIPEEDMKILGSFTQEKYTWNPDSIV